MPVGAQRARVSVESDSKKSAEDGQESAPKPDTLAPSSLDV